MRSRDVGNAKRSTSRTISGPVIESCSAHASNRRQLVATTMYAIEDEIHAEPHGEFSTRDQAIEELKRRAAIPWNEAPNVAPCMSCLLQLKVSAPLLGRSNDRVRVFSFIQEHLERSDDLKQCFLVGTLEGLLDMSSRGAKCLSRVLPCEPEDFGNQCVDVVSAHRKGRSARSASGTPRPGVRPRRRSGCEAPCGR